MRTRPGRLTTVCIIAIVLGCMGLISCLTRLVALTAAPQLNEAIIQQMPEPQAQLQLEMVAKINAITSRWKPVLYLLCLAHFVLAGSLLVGGMMTMMWKPAGRKLLTATMLGGIAFELIKAVPEGMIQFQNQMVSKEYMGRIMAAQPNANGAAALGDAIASGIMFMSFAIMAAWALAKIVYYALGARYLRKPELDALFIPEPEM